jgi:hypothetical protein
MLREHEIKDEEIIVVAQRALWQRQLFINHFSSANFSKKHSGKLVIELSHPMTTT